MRKMALFLVLVLLLCSCSHGGQPPGPSPGAAEVSQSGTETNDVSVPKQEDEDASSSVAASESSGTDEESSRKAEDTTEAAPEIPPYEGSTVSAREHPSPTVAAQEEIPFRFVDSNNNPVHGLSATIFSLPQRVSADLYDRNGKGYSGEDGILYYPASEYYAQQKDAEETVLIVTSAFGSGLRKDYTMDLLSLEASYAFVWDLPLPLERSIQEGILLRVVDADGNPLEGIAFQVVSIFFNDQGQPITGPDGIESMSFTSPSDPNGVIILTPAWAEESVYTYGDITFEIDYTPGTLVEKTVTVDTSLLTPGE